MDCPEVILLVTPFEEDNKQYREQGSYRFSEEQRNAYILIFTIQVLSFVNEPYASFKTLPQNGFWGKATIFYGAEVIRTVPMEYAKQRFIHVIARDNLNAALIGASLATVQSGLIAVAIVAGGSIGAQPLNLPDVSGFPETVIKFRGLPLAQYQFTCYWQPQQSGFAEFIEPFAEDPTDGDDEYPEPRRNSADDPYANNAPSSPFDPDSDPRDFVPIGSGFNAGIGNASYQFRDAASGGFQANTIDGLGFPGILFASTAANGNNEVSYRDAQGAVTVLVEGASPPVQVQSFIIIVPNSGSTYAPNPNSFSN